MFHKNTEGSFFYDSQSMYFHLSNRRVSCQEYPFFSSPVLSFFFLQCCSTLSAQAVCTDVKSFFDRPNGRLFFFPFSFLWTEAEKTPTTDPSCIYLGYRESGTKKFCRVQALWFFYVFKTNSNRTVADVNQSTVSDCVIKHLSLYFFIYKMNEEGSVSSQSLFGAYSVQSDASFKIWHR